MVGVLVAEILTEVNDAQGVGKIVLLHDFFGLAVADAEKQGLYIGLEGVSKSRFGVAKQVGVYFVPFFTRLAVAVGKSNFCKRVAQQQAQQFAARITGAAEEADAYFFSRIHKMTG
jgi:hypothetical protein